MNAAPQRKNPRDIRGATLAGLLLAALLTGCGKGNPTSGAVQTPPPPASRPDLQVPGLIELVDDDLSMPVLPPNPSQADLGSELYYQICLACHGDWGQGLSDGWRAEWGEDQDCWQSKCHASNHPPWGFELPREIPPVLGMGSLARYSNATELYDYILHKMPWWNPGSLSEEEAWALTAYLMRSRGEIVNEVSLDLANAPIFRLHVPATPVADFRPGAIALIIALTLATIAFILTSGRDAAQRG